MRLGVRSIEHGNMLDEASAAAMADAGAFLSQSARLRQPHEALWARAFLSARLLPFAFI